jgi:uncharacterized protein (DUF2252 family)
MAVAACGADSVDAREVEVAGAIASADELLVRQRPGLVAGKYDRMTGSAFAYFRGSLAVYAYDWRRAASGLSWTSFALDALVPSLGDAHPENFGTLLGADGVLALEPNDFDAADLAPPLWDLRRLSVGMVLAARLSNEGDEPGRTRAAAAAGAIARAVSVGYTDELARLAKGGAPLRVTDDGGNAILADVFGRAGRDRAARRELASLTILDGAVRRLRRGVLDPAEPTRIFAELPERLRATLPDVLARYRGTLTAPPAPEFFTVLDAVRELGSGVASWPRVRAILLVRGLTDDPGDDVLLELKELADPPRTSRPPPFVQFESVQARVVDSARKSWARPDAEPFWGASVFAGLPVQLRAESEAHKTVRISRMIRERGTPDALAALAQRLGAILARIHASDGLPPALAQVAETRAAEFADEQATVALRYADQVASDVEHFKRALARRGPRLGVPAAEGDAPSAELRALFEGGEP